MNFFDFTPQFDAPYWGTNVQGSYCPKTKEYPFGSKLVLALNAPENSQALEMCFECGNAAEQKKPLLCKPIFWVSDPRKGACSWEGAVY